MTPLPFVFPYAIAFWAVFVWAFTPEFRIVRNARHSAGRADSPDAGSYRVIVIGMQLASIAAFPLAWMRVFQVTGALRVPCFVAGVAVMVGGSLLRRHCWRMLGASFTGDVQARPDQAIVTAGAYALLRHPSYTAGLLLNTGFGLALGSWASALLMALASFAVYTYRIAVEERALLAAVGEPYRAFMRDRKRMIPFLY